MFGSHLSDHRERVDEFEAIGIEIHPLARNSFRELREIRGVVGGTTSEVEVGEFFSDEEESFSCGVEEEFAFPRERIRNGETGLSISDDDTQLGIGKPATRRPD